MFLSVYADLQKNIKIMCMLSRAYPRFLRIVENETGQMAALSVSNGRNAFDKVCRMLKVSPVDFDEFLNEELGYGGEEIMSLFLSGFREHPCKGDKVLDSEPLGAKVKDGV